MIDRLTEILLRVEQLPAEMQEVVATSIEVLLGTLERDATMHKYLQKMSSTTDAWKDPVGAWNDLPDTTRDGLDQLRHTTSPTPPIEQL